MCGPHLARGRSTTGLLLTVAGMCLWLGNQGDISAQTRAESGKKIALLIGVNNYEKRGFRDLEYAERDVEEMKPLLEKAGYEVHLLTGNASGKARATLANIRSTIGTVLKDRTKRDLLLVALAGHGLQIEVPAADGKAQSDSFFCPCDAVHGEPKTMLSMSSLFEEINRRGGGSNLVLVDACREDPTRGRGMDGSTVKTLPEGVAVLFGCRAGQKTYETKKASGGHGVFFHFVLAGLRGEATNARGNVTWGQLVEYVSEKVAEETPALLGDAAIQQTPNLIANLPGTSPVMATALPPAAAKAPLATLRGLLMRTVYKNDAQRLGLDQTRGVMVLLPFQEGAPPAAGLQRDDVIVALDGEEVTTEECLRRLKSGSKGGVIQCDVWRGGTTRRIELKVALDAPASHAHALGLAEKGDIAAEYCAAAQLAEGYGARQDLAEAIRRYRAAAAKGSVDSMSALGAIYRDGQGVAQDLAQASEYFRKAADLGDPDAQYQLGRTYEDKKDVAQAFEWYRKAASNDYRDAQYQMGVCYESGVGVKADLVQAVSWYRRAAEGGHAAGLNALGWMYLNGLGVARDYAMGLKHLRRAVQRGDTRGRASLGMAYERGWGVEQDYGKAVELYRQAAEKGDSWGQCRLGDAYWNGIVEKDYAEAIRWYRKAAESGDADGENSLGNAYDAGKGVTQDYAQAVRWYRKAAEKGNDLGKFNLGRMYEDGNGVTRDYEQAIKWYYDAAVKELPEAQRAMGNMILYARGVDRDYAIAMKWFRLAADQGFAEAQNDMGVMYHNGWGVKRNNEEAVRWYRKAAAQGHELAKENLQKLGR